MKRIWTWCLIGLISLGSATWSRAQQTGETEKAVAALEEQWLKAQNANSPDLLTPLLADKFVSTSPEGKVSSKAETMAELKSYVKDSGTYPALKVIAYGDTAIAVGILKMKQKDPSGKIVDLNIQWTDTWVKMPNGKWQCVASHGSSIKM
jgi:ketosteroid isomerase-like protein